MLYKSKHARRGHVPGCGREHNKPNHLWMLLSVCNSWGELLAAEERRGGYDGGIPIRVRDHFSDCHGRRPIYALEKCPLFEGDLPTHLSSAQRNAEKARVIESRTARDRFRVQNC